MGILYTIIVGFIVGLLARFIMPGRDSAGIIVTTLLGVAGAIVANFVGQGLGLNRVGESSGFVASVLGAVILLAVYRLIIRNRRQHT